MNSLPVTWPYHLRSGHSADPAQGACAMDAVNWLVHGKHGDTPECACPVIASYVIRGNDAMPDDVRQRLLGYLHRIAGSRSAEHEAARLRVLVLAAARVFAPIALEAAGWHKEAEALRALPDNAPYVEIQAVAQAAWRAAWPVTPLAAWAATEAWAAAGAAAWRAAWAAAWAAKAVGDWDLYFAVLDDVLNAGPQGEPWSADAVELGAQIYANAGGAIVPAEMA